MDMPRLAASRSLLIYDISVFYAFGHNQFNINNCACDNNRDCIHAEVDCMNNLKKTHKQKNISIFVFRTNNKGDKLMMARPCQNCYNAIDFNLKKKNFKLKTIYYSDESGEIKKY